MTTFQETGHKVKYISIFIIEKMMIQPAMPKWGKKDCPIIFIYLRLFFFSFPPTVLTFRFRWSTVLTFEH